MYDISYPPLLILSDLEISPYKWTSKTFCDLAIYVRVAPPFSLTTLLEYVNCSCLTLSSTLNPI